MIDEREECVAGGGLLHRRAQLAPDARLDGPALSRTAMPNRDGFVSLERQGFDGDVERAGEKK